MKIFFILLASLLLTATAQAKGYRLLLTDINGNQSTAVGFFVKNDKGQVVGATAAHFCNDAPLKLFDVHDKQKRVGTVRVILINVLHDVCLFVREKGLKNVELSEMLKFGEYSPKTGKSYLNNTGKLVPIKMKRILRAFVNSPNVVKAPIPTPIPVDYYRPKLDFGSSGAPLYDDYGKVVGMVILISEPMKLTITIPSSTLNRFLGVGVLK
jgi:hypothetical protein